MSASPVWPPTGIALVAMLVLGYRVWPAIFVGAFIVNLTTAGSVATSLGIAAGNTLEGVIGAVLLNRFARGRSAFDRASDIFRFTVLAGLLSTAVSATFGVTALALGGYASWSIYGAIWLTWWMGDVAGNLVVTPLLLSWIEQPGLGRLRRQWIEAALLALVVVLVGQGVFGGLGLGAKNYPVAFACLPVLLWAAFRFGRREAATATAVLAVTAVWGTLRGLGPFAVGTPNESLLLLQAFMATMAVTVLPVAALVWQGKQAEESVRQSAERYRLATETGGMGTWEWAIAMGRVTWSPSLEAIHGMAPGSFPGTLQAVLDEAHPDDRQTLQSAVASAIEGGHAYRLEYRIVRRDGATRWVEGRGRVLRDERGRAERMIGVCMDVTDRKQSEDERLRLLIEEQAARRLAQEAERRLAFLGEVARSITSSLDLDTVLQRIAEGAKDLCGGDSAAIFLRDGQSPAMVPRYRVGPWLSTYHDLRVEPGQGLGGQVMVTGRAARSEHYRADPRISPNFQRVTDEGGTIALMVVPIVIDRGVEGLLYLNNAAPRIFTDEDEKICRRLADQAAVAIQNATLFAREKARRREAEAITEIAKALTLGLDPQIVAQRAVDEARILLGVVTAVVYRRDPDTEDLVAVAVAGSMGPTFGVGGRLPRGLGTAGRAILERRAVTTPNVLTDPGIPLDPQAQHWIEQAPYRAVLAMPLAVKDTVIGVFAAGDREGREFTAEDVRVAQSFADHAAIALENARLFAREQMARVEAQRAEGRATFLAEASGVLASSLDHTTTLGTVSRLAVPTFADWCIIDLLTRQDSIERVAVSAADPVRQALVQELRRYAPDRWSSQPAARTLRSGDALLITEVTDETLVATAGDAGHLELLRRLDPGSMIVMPMRARQRVVAVITLVRDAGSPRYDAADMTVAAELADRAALAVDNAMLYQEAELARAHAEAANRAKDEFLAVLSHELRTPMNAVYGWARMLQTRQLDPATVSRATDAVVRNAHAQLQLIEDLLDVSRVITGKMRLDIRPVDLAKVLEAALDAVRPAADAKDIQLLSILDPPIGPMQGDPDRLQQVAWNLLMNAVKFTPREGRVQLVLRRVDSHVEIVVSDTGQGIAADVLPFIFDRFRQGDSSSTRANTGLGIGLALVRHLVELHGGTVSVQSAGEHRGATFRVRLPLAVSRITSPAESASSGSARPVAGYSGPSLRGLRVLAVDDDHDARELLKTILGGAGAEVAVCASTGEAVALVRSWSPHVLVSDIEMPGEDGYTFIRRVRALAPMEGGKIPAVALTGYGRPEDRIRALSAGYNMHVPKPVDPAELGVIVASLAGRSSAPDLASPASG
jgi:PAS domain S-box-containing protein